jgi:hypothetical protein
VRRFPWSIALAAAAVIAAGAGVAFALLRDEQPCTLIGAVTEVSVELSAEHRRADRVTVCAGGRCGELRREATAAAVPVRADGPSRVSVQLIAERDGERPDIRSGVVRLRRFEPNGPGCAPVVWRVDVDSGSLDRPAAHLPVQRLGGPEDP